MKRIALFTLVFLFCAAVALAVPVKAPTLPAPLIARFFKAQAERARAQLALEHDQAVLQTKNAAIQSTVQAMQAACGADYVPFLDPQGDPVCTPRPQAGKVKPVQAKK